MFKPASMVSMTTPPNSFTVRAEGVERYRKKLEANQARIDAIIKSGDYSGLTDKELNKLYKDSGSQSTRDIAWAEKQKRIGAKRAVSFENIYAPKVQEYGAQMERDALSAFQREKAMALQGLGFRQSAGYGDSGLYQAAELALDRAAAAKAGEIAGTSENFERAAFLNYLDREDQQQFQLQAMRLQYEYQMKMAEANSSSWWEGIGSIVGFAASVAFAPETGGASMAATPTFV